MSAPLRDALLDSPEMATRALAGTIHAGILAGMGRERPRQELLCEVCDLEYPVWFAPNEIWNAVIRGDDRGAPDVYSFLCIDCFALMAEQHGYAPTAWALVPAEHLDRQETLMETSTPTAPTDWREKIERLRAGAVASKKASKKVCLAYGSLWTSFEAMERELDRLQGIVDRATTWAGFGHCSNIDELRRILAGFLDGYSEPVVEDQPFDIRLTYPLLHEIAVEHDARERSGGTNTPLQDEIDAAMREIWDARRANRAGVRETDRWHALAQAAEARADEAERDRDQWKEQAREWAHASIENREELDEARTLLGAVERLTVDASVTYSTFCPTCLKMADDPNVITTPMMTETRPIRRAMGLPEIGDGVLRFSSPEESGAGPSAAAVDGAGETPGHHEAVGERQGRQPAPDALREQSTWERAYVAARNMRAAMSLAIDEGDDTGEHVGLQRHRRAVLDGYDQILRLFHPDYREQPVPPLPDGLYLDDTDDEDTPNQWLVFDASGARVATLNEWSSREAAEYLMSTVGRRIEARRVDPTAPQEPGDV